MPKRKKDNGCGNKPRKQAIVCQALGLQTIAQRFPRRVPKFSKATICCLDKSVASNEVDLCQRKKARQNRITPFGTPLLPVRLRSFATVETCPTFSSRPLLCPLTVL
jgi:hypothetical protein